jgi:allophanate hydrolase
MIGSLQRASLHRGYGEGAFTPADVVAAVHDRIEARGQDNVWIHLVDRASAIAEAEDLARRYAGRDLPPLFGLPFAVKDNVDVAGLPTTAACPDFAYVARESATVVERALAAGAICIGKTNLDQFATGLTGTRSPYGVVRNPFDPDVIAGGSSSGSAVSVAAGLATFAIGTDTAGSGRVPAGLTGTVGVKPTRGLVSTRGIVPACRSLDCPSVFALSVADGAAVLAVVAGQDASDPFSRDLPVPPPVPAPPDLNALRIGVPAHALGLDDDAAAAFEAAVARLGRLGVRVVPVDLRPFMQVGDLLYGGPWVAERLADLEHFVSAHPDALHPVTRQILTGAIAVSGADAFRGMHALAQGRASTAAAWADADVILVPTAPEAPTVEESLADPFGPNARLGRFTNFVNLLDLAAIALPSSMTPAGVPVGVTFLGPAGSDGLLAGLGEVWQRAAGLPVGATGFALEAAADPSAALGTGAAREVPADEAGADHADEVLIAVVGAHLAGEPLNPVLFDLGARLHARTRTAQEYRLLALPGLPARPGLVRVTEGGGAVDAEVYRMPAASVGPLLAGVPAPLGLGPVRLGDGSSVLGFLCESAGAQGAVDITWSGGWRAYRQSLSRG